MRRIVLLYTCLFVSLSIFAQSYQGCPSCSSNGRVFCVNCSGTGRVFYSGPFGGYWGACVYCEGQGRVICGNCHGNGKVRTADIDIPDGYVGCYFCAQYGTINGRTCSNCSGKGYKPKPRYIPTPTPSPSTSSDCTWCNGNGLCHDCGGSGVRVNGRVRAVCGKCGGNRKCHICKGSGKRNW